MGMDELYFLLKQKLKQSLRFPKDHTAYMGRIKLMYNIGYGISLVSLILAVTIMIYFILSANYMWIVTEGIYLHMLITIAMFSEKSGIKKLVLFGLVILFVIPLVIVRATLEDEVCWNTHPTHGYFWMIRGLMVVAMVLNIFIFLNIIKGVVYQTECILKTRC